MNKNKNTSNSTIPEKFKRRISPNELLWIALQSLFPPYAIQNVIEGCGNLNLSDVKAAVEIASDSCPGSRLIIEGQNWIDSGIAPPVIEIDEENFDGYNFENASFFTRDLNPITGPTCEVVLLKNRSTIVFRAFHGVMDGSGILHWAKDVFRVLNGKTPLGGFSIANEEDIASSQKVENIEYSFDSWHPSPFGRNIISTTEFSNKRFILNGNFPGLVAKIATIIVKTSGQPHLRFMIPVDLRRHLKDEFSTGNVTLGIYPDVNLDDTWEDVQKNILLALNNRLELNTNQSDQLFDLSVPEITKMFKQQNDFQAFTRIYRVSVLISNTLPLNLEDLSTPSFKANTIYTIPQQVSLTPLAIGIVELPTHAEIVFSYGKSSFSDELIEKICNNLIEEIEKPIIKSPENELTLAFCSTFSTNQVGKYIGPLCSEFGINIKTKFCPYNQVYQQLLDPTSLISTNNGMNLLMIRFEDIKYNLALTELTKILSEKEKQIPYLVCIFPLSQSSLKPEMIDILKETYSKWKKSLESMDNLHILDLSNLSEIYHVNKIFDSEREIAAHIPFTDEYFAALDAIIARKICAYVRNPFKVIVLDCDNTLWKGVCGEDGPNGIKIHEAHKAFQEFILQKYNDGVLLAICSKNSPQDVENVFDQNPEMILKKEHFAVMKINWNPKSANIKEISSELKLGLNSFIFIDDNSVECFEVMEHCPQVLTLQMPQNPLQINSFISHMWATDVFSITAEDRMRNSMYISEKKRNEGLDTCASLNDFLHSLNIKLYFSSAQEVDFQRISQLSQRTNQFNFSGIRRTLKEVVEISKNPDTRCYIISAIDKFGDYGQVGTTIVNIFEENASNYVFIESFLLSCRVLGRSIESALLCALKKVGIANNSQYLRTKFVPTASNKPALDFLMNSGWKIVEECSNYTIFELGINEICDNIDFIDLKYDERPISSNEISSYNAVTKKPSEIENHVSPLSTNPEPMPKEAEFKLSLGHINDENLVHLSYIKQMNYTSAKDIIKQISLSDNINNKLIIEPKSEMEKTLVHIWSKLFNLDKISTDDDFFALGGSSLLAIELEIELKKIGISLELIHIYRNSVLHKLATQLEKI